MVNMIHQCQQPAALLRAPDNVCIKNTKILISSPNPISSDQSLESFDMVWGKNKDIFSKKMCHLHILIWNPDLYTTSTELSQSFA